MKGLLLLRNELSEVTIGGLASLQELVGGYIEAAFTVPSPDGDHEITAYVNDEGLISGLDIRTVVIQPTGYEQPLAGPMVFTGLNPQNGETIGLTDTDVAYIRQRLVLLPVYQYERYLFPQVSVLSLVP